ncbi:hypothetical protein FHS85_002725 [Rhodoligotrophos appendicifer]|uniref:SLATT domain-containing protein n=1 Tax=Rhodoligotrophos appendicifer TaxID=987056 RepID=UPI00118555D4|nr:SLATT domain-containing protein [Rhodoligotrophos appendicifer]
MSEDLTEHNRGGKEMDDRKKAEKDLAYERKKSFQESLKYEEDWYRRQGRKYSRRWALLTLSILILTTATSVLAALDLNQFGIWERVVLSVLPAMAGLFTAILSSFQIAGYWELREKGRIDIIELRDRVRLLTAANDEEMRRKLAPFRQELLEITREQATGFFSALSRRDLLAERGEAALSSGQGNGNGKPARIQRESADRSARDAA